MLKFRPLPLDFLGQVRRQGQEEGGQLVPALLGMRIKENQMQRHLHRITAKTEMENMLTVDEEVTEKLEWWPHS